MIAFPVNASSILALIKFSKKRKKKRNKIRNRCHGGCSISLVILCVLRLVLINQKGLLCKMYYIWSKYLLIHQRPYLSAFLPFKDSNTWFISYISFMSFSPKSVTTLGIRHYHYLSMATFMWLVFDEKWSLILLLSFEHIVLV